MTPLAPLLALAALVLLLTTPARAAECVPTTSLDPTTQSAAGQLRVDRRGRMVAPVMVNGQGPFSFVVDTGANRSVLSYDLATQLGLTPIGTGEVHSVHGVMIAPIVEVESLRYGPLTMATQPLPLLQGPVLAGQRGLLGVDGMSGRRLRLDFTRNCIEITPSSEARRLPGWTRVRGRLRFGHLVVLPGRVRGIDVNIFVDTGSDSSLANLALQEALRARGDMRTREDALAFARAYHAGEPVVLQNAIAIPELRVGNLTVTDLVVYAGDFHIFHLWNIQNEPSMLVGMDVLRLARGIAIDYGRGEVYFRVRRQGLISIDPNPGRRRR